MCKIIDDIVQRECKEVEIKAEIRGEEKERIKTALRMIEKGKYSVEEIAEMSNLSVSEVEEIIKKRSA